MFCCVCEVHQIYKVVDQEEREGISAFAIECCSSTPCALPVDSCSIYSIGMISILSIFSNDGRTGGLSGFA